MVQLSATLSMPLVLLALLIMSSFPLPAASASSSSAPPSDAQPGARDYDLDDLPPGRAPEDAQTARYAMVSKLHFDSEAEATDALRKIAAGTVTFLDLAEERQQFNTRLGRGEDRDAQSGDLGLITADMVEPEIAHVAFDIRQPVTESPKDLLGPICTAKGCSLIAVFRRYRRSFFSNAWYDAETFAKENGIRFMELLERLDNGEGLKEIAFLVWPDEHISIKKVRVQQLRNDVRRVGTVDPSTINKRAQGRGDPAAHRRLMAQRKHLFAQVPQEVIAEHPEIYAMSIEQIVAAGWAPAEFDAAATVADAEAESDAGGVNCARSEGGPGCSDFVRHTQDTPPPVVDGDDVDVDISSLLEKTRDHREGDEF